ncbi:MULTISPECIES: Lrp/AsnC family transcriptional regulator [unclassified Herbaspirillum]|uniref:Lrp/AsnC family transcriptional regulator n=1 Tax=unclassified Herbaspirillum TaxID=2624150 RepID=UPI00114F41AE|nr:MULTISPECIES: Lrp/AsnC family transcriptional regulator [unclassified Herbaspirillum]MBB5393884.1 DNA-binding Lrp family transcriptional regulator [Herbaspirillum sp. SJZ102]TQK00078.1 AsnC family transcriptional regulator [Herbaspirillum sp. SJZ130]TQK04597.1 AsnC family transcriptional regulator [Herbaspirillum sp. SJZ106]TWC63170.1 AsnC family transcriptional regulator [Herbaspirillum sp. SJZ099]
MKTRLDTLDDTDRNLIALLQVSARESVANLARKLGVARTTVVARLARLEKNGIIAGYTVKLGQEVTDNALRAYVGITVEAKAARDVLKRFRRMPEIELLCSVSGEFDYVAWLRASSAERLDQLLDEIGEIDGVTRTTTSIVLARKIER